jgi:glycosyltransferase involved in cell wall biosynthesis
LYLKLYDVIIFCVKTHVIIAAKNEQRHVGTTLASLPGDAMPIVVTNGSSDRTAEISESFGAKVVVLEEPSKVAAIQEGVRLIGKSATEGFVILDADTRPLFPRGWISSYQEVFEGDHSVTCGPLFFGADRGRIISFMRSARSYARDLRNFRTRGGEHVYGANMGIKTNDGVIQEILGLPNIWPCEDMALRDLVVQGGGTFSMSLKPQLAVVSSARAYQTLSQRVLGGRAHSKAAAEKWYASSAPKNKVSYDDWTAKRVEGKT